MKIAHAFNGRIVKFGKIFEDDLNRRKEEYIPINLTYYLPKSGLQFLRCWSSKSSKTADLAIF